MNLKAKIREVPDWPIKGVSFKDITTLLQDGKTFRYVIDEMIRPFQNKKIGCTHILATTACGSLREKFKPGDIIFIDQFIDNTKHRTLTFYEDKLVHTPMAEPFDENLRKKLINAAKKLKIKYHSGGTMITIEGPRFSTKAESKMFRSWGADLINMSSVPEVILAKELGIPYQAIAMSTDYDSWKDDEEPVTIELVFKRMRENVEKVKQLLIETIKDY